MQYIDKQVKVAKEFYEVFGAMGVLVDSYKVAIKDGWQPGMDIPSIVLGSLPALGQALTGLDQVPGEFKTSTDFNNSNQGGMGLFSGWPLI